MTISLALWWLSYQSRCMEHGLRTCCGLAASLIVESAGDVTACHFLMQPGRASPGPGQFRENRGRDLSGTSRCVDSSCSPWPRDCGTFHTPEQEALLIACISRLKSRFYRACCELRAGGSRIIHFSSVLNNKTNPLVNFHLFVRRGTVRWTITPDDLMFFLHNKNQDTRKCVTRSVEVHKRMLHQRYILSGLSRPDDISNCQIFDSCQICPFS